MENLNLNENKVIADANDKLLNSIANKIKNYNFDEAENTIMAKHQRLLNLCTNEVYKGNFKTMNIFMEFPLNDISINEQMCSYFSKKLTEDNKSQCIKIEVINALAFNNTIESFFNYCKDIWKDINKCKGKYKSLINIQKNYPEMILFDSEEIIQEATSLIDELKSEMEAKLKENSVYVLIYL